MAETAGIAEERWEGLLDAIELGKVVPLVGRRLSLVQNKPADALTSLEAISDKATDLATAAKPKRVDATGINTSVSAAITCVAANY